jgi:uncharacterized protein YjiS (DUF1127 family)
MKHAKQCRRAGAARATQAHGIFPAQNRAARIADFIHGTRRSMLFLDLYGTPRAHAASSTSHLPHALQTLVQKIAVWKREAHDRRVLSRMTIRQLEDLQLSWPDDIRNIRTH